ncbi:hypothetical protein Hanom_Chr07g00588971 [Helianthus anomalus]
MELEAGSEIMKGFIDQGVNWLFLKVWGKTIKVKKPQGAKQKFTQEIMFLFSFKISLSSSTQQTFIRQTCNSNFFLSYTSLEQNKSKYQSSR